MIQRRSVVRAIPRDRDDMPAFLQEPHQAHFMRRTRPRKDFGVFGDIACLFVAQLLEIRPRNHPVIRVLLFPQMNLPRDFLRGFGVVAGHDFHLDARVAAGANGVRHFRADWVGNRRETKPHHLMRDFLDVGMVARGVVIGKGQRPHAALLIAVQILLNLLLFLLGKRAFALRRQDAAAARQHDFRRAFDV